MVNGYINKKNILLLLAAMKSYGVKRVIVSPGTTNMMFVGSIQQDPYFKLFSAPDERSAAYMACGMASESNEPVALTCTGATASRNYMPGLTEGYYRKLPILVITSLLNGATPGQLMPQVIDRSVVPNDIVVAKDYLYETHSKDDEYKCTLKLNILLDKLTKKKGGPVHINLVADICYDFSVKELPLFRRIKSYTVGDELPTITSGKKIAIFIGAHKTWKKETIEIIEEFCNKYNAIVLRDNTSNYYGNHGINYSLVAGQEQINREKIKMDLVIDIGEVSGDYYVAPSIETWRVSESGEIQDRFKNLTAFFDFSEEEFFQSYIQKKNDVDSCELFYQQSKELYQSIYKQIPPLPFSNIWIAKQLYSKIPSNSVIHFGILNSLRAWNFFELDPTISGFSNVGGFGIDGALSTVIGASLINQDKLYFCVLGDLAFFYDMNVLGNRCVGDNLRILLINNGVGTEFKNYSHPCAVLEEKTDLFIAAKGHYGNKSQNLVKDYVSNLGFRYIAANNKDEFLAKYEEFYNPEGGSIVFEIFTNDADESKALYEIRNIVRDLSVKSIVKKVVGKQNIQKIKEITNR